MIGLDLHAIAAPFVAIVNPPVPGSHRANTGYATALNGKRTPTYADARPVNVQVQALSGGELELMEGLNIQGVKRAMYLDGDVRGVDRDKGDGGDLITFDALDPAVPPPLQGTTWLISVVLEAWDNPGWCKVGVIKQLTPAVLNAGP